jgi:hypothetical protein
VSAYVTTQVRVFVMPFVVSIFEISRLPRAAVSLTSTTAMTSRRSAPFS